MYSRERMRDYMREWRKTPKGKESKRISREKYRLTHICVPTSWGHAFVTHSQALVLWEYTRKERTRELVGKVRESNR